MEEQCYRCLGWFKDDDIWINIPHTDVYYCKPCYFHDQPERLNPEDGNAVCDSLNSMET